MFPNWYPMKYRTFFRFLKGNVISTFCATFPPQTLPASSKCSALLAGYDSEEGMDLSIRSQRLANDSHKPSTSLQGQNLVVFLEITGHPPTKEGRQSWGCSWLRAQPAASTLRVIQGRRRGWKCTERLEHTLRGLRAVSPTPTLRL